MKKLIISGLICLLIIGSASAHNIKFYLFDAATNNELQSAYILVKTGGLTVNVKYSSDDTHDLTGQCTFIFTSEGYIPDTLVTYISSSQTIRRGLQPKADAILHVPVSINKKLNNRPIKVYTIAGRLIGDYSGYDEFRYSHKLNGMY